MLATLGTIGLVLLGIIILIGIIRLIIEPANGFWDFMGQLFMLDLLGDVFGWIIETISDFWD